MAEGARLESVYTFTGIGGSNPSLSAIFKPRLIPKPQSTKPLPTVAPMSQCTSSMAVNQGQPPVPREGWSRML